MKEQDLKLYMNKIMECTVVKTTFYTAIGQFEFTGSPKDSMVKMSEYMMLYGDVMFDIENIKVKEIETTNSNSDNKH
jgi:hypothetical protein